MTKKSPFEMLTLCEKNTNKVNNFVVLSYFFDSLPKDQQELILSAHRSLSPYVVAVFPVNDFRDLEVQETRARFLFNTLIHQYHRTVGPELNEELLEKVNSGMDRSALLVRVTEAL